MLKTLEDLINIIRDRKNSSPDISYTKKLLEEKISDKSKVKEEIDDMIESCI